MHKAITAEAAKKRENQRRKAALKKLKRKRVQEFTVGDCKSLGDCVFAFYCRADEEVLTTNIKDHELFTTAIGRAVKKP